MVSQINGPDRDMKDIVKAMLLRGTNVLLARRSSGRRNYPDRWSFPGGHVETGEALDDALMRELQEEIGFDAACVLENRGKLQNQIHRSTATPYTICTL